MGQSGFGLNQPVFFKRTKSMATFLERMNKINQGDKMHIMPLINIIQF